jgi:hypothetical protein
MEEVSGQMNVKEATKVLKTRAFSYFFFFFFFFLPFLQKSILLITYIQVEPLQ